MDLAKSRAGRSCRIPPISATRELWKAVYFFSGCLFMSLARLGAAEQHSAIASTPAITAVRGEVLLSQGVFATVTDEFASQESRTIQLRGREIPFSVRVLRMPGAIAASS